MNEFQLIEKYLGGVGYRIKDLRYFRQYLAITSEAGYDIGAAQGFPANHQFFFGNISIWINLMGALNLAKQNIINTHFSTLLYGGVETSDLRIALAPGAGISLLGDGTYIGNKRLYGLSCNRVSILKVDFPAGTFAIEIAFNGYMWTIM
jgi:hypothetical protein